MGWLMKVLHPELLHAPFRVWALRGERLEESELGPLASPHNLGPGQRGNGGRGHGGAAEIYRAFHQ